MKEAVKKIPILGPTLRAVYRFFKPIKPFENSRLYWEERYRDGGGSGPGSYGKLAEFKSCVINEFVLEQNIKKVIEHGCGDGNQLCLARYKEYLGLDISPASISICRKMFAHDNSKRFETIDNYDGETAELALSLDVIFHLVEDDIYRAYMKRLFQSSEKYVIIYSSNTDVAEVPSQHEKPRKFSVDVEGEFSDWKLTQHIPNKYPYSGDAQISSTSDFYIYQKNTR